MSDWQHDPAILLESLRTDTVLRRTSPTKNAVNARARARIREALLTAHGPYCWLCNRHLGDDEPTLDHVVPRSKGGRNAIANLRLAHFACNQRRGNGPVPELMLTKSMMVKAE